MNTPKAIQNFPKTYRAKEMRILAQWLRAGESGSVVGLPGCGRNNLLNFLCYRPDVLRGEYLGSEADQIVVIPVDLSHLPTNDAATLYRVILRAFYWLRQQLPDTLQERVTALYLENRATQDPFLAQSGLYEMLLAFRSEGVRVALVLNRFDQFCQEADPRMFATLRSLRDSFKEVLSLIVGLHRDIIYLPNRQALGDLYPVLDNNVCWIGSMSEADSRWVIQQAIHAAPERPGEVEIEQILALSGGFPTLLRFITGWWLNQTPKPPLDRWLSLLSGEPLFEHRLKELWDGLTQEEQSILAVTFAGKNQVATRVKPDYQRILSHLVTKGVAANRPGLADEQQIMGRFYRATRSQPGKTGPE
ncbi:MAG: hypothetical protein HC875_31405 [Anaerolineales bacterium]|nr:hypothetical protein [Anaerolineales bacterium]